MRLYMCDLYMRGAYMMMILYMRACFCVSALFCKVAYTILLLLLEIYIQYRGLAIPTLKDVHLTFFITLRKFALGGVMG